MPPASPAPDADRTHAILFHRQDKSARRIGADDLERELAHPDHMLWLDSIKGSIEKPFFRLKTRSERRRTLIMSFANQ